MIAQSEQQWPRLGFSQKTIGSIHPDVLGLSARMILNTTLAFDYLILASWAEAANVQ